MSRGSIPRFDLYAELEISRLASVEVIEAAYRALVKRHHPDVSAAADAERIKRLNVAREWLVSPTRRARYDAATGAGPHRPLPTPEGQQQTSDRVVRASAATRPAAEPARPVRPSSAASFGVHSREVRQFLAHLRTLDAGRAQELHDAKASLDPKAYAAARSASLAASRDARNHEWTFAREAASVIARGKLAHAPLGADVVAIVADIAGAIVVRDLLSAQDFQLLLGPWTGRDEPGLGAGTLPTAGAPVRPVPGVARLAVLEPVAATFGLAVARALAAARARPPIAIAVAAVLVAVVGLGLLGGGRPAFEGAVAGLTSPPGTFAPRGSSNVGASVEPSAPGVVIAPSAEPSGTPPASSLAPVNGEPTPIPGIGTPRPSPRSTPSPRPSSAATPSPTPVPTPTPTPSPTPSPTPTPSPEPTPSPRSNCTVPNLVGMNTSEAAATWAAVGFTGVITFAPLPPPQYKIGWQSLTAGTEALCTSDIAVQQVAP